MQSLLFQISMTIIKQKITPSICGGRGYASFGNEDYFDKSYYTTFHFRMKEQFQMEGSDLYVDQMSRV